MKEFGTERGRNFHVYIWKDRIPGEENDDHKGPELECS